MSGSFGARLETAMLRHGPLCVGIDPHPALLSEWGLRQDAGGIAAFGRAVVAAASGRAAAVKPQVAFFERFGSHGFAALEEVLAAAREAELLVIADAKRGDIGTTMAGYAAAWLDPGSPLEADALTLSPYLGPESLRETVRHAIGADKGVFVLAATSNPEAAALQGAQTHDVASTPGQTVAQRVVRDVVGINSSPAFAGGFGPIGVVIGATVDRAEYGLDDAELAATPILAPGFGAQGATVGDLRGRFGAVAGQVVVSESRSILRVGPDALARTILARNDEYREALDA